MSNLKVGVIWTILGNGMNSGSQWIILVILTQFSSLTTVGNYALILSVITPVCILTGLSLRAVYVSNIENIPFSTFRVLRYYSILLSLILSLLILAMLTKLNYELVLLVFLVWLIKGLDSISDIYYCLLYSDSKNDIIGRAIFYRGIISIITFSLSFWAFKSLDKSLIITSFALIVRTFFYDRRFIENGASKKACSIVNYKSMMKLIKIAMPLGIASFIVSFSSNIPKYFVEMGLGREDLAVYSSIAYIVVLGSLPVTAVGVTLRPKLYRYFLDSNYHSFFWMFFKGILLCTVMGLSLLLVSFLFGEILLTSIYGSNFSGYSNEFVWACSASVFIFSGSYSMFALTSIGKYKQGLYFTITSVVVVFIICYGLYSYSKITISDMFIAWGIGGGVLSLSVFNVILELLRMRNNSKLII